MGQIPQNNQKQLKNGQTQKKSKNLNFKLKKTWFLQSPLFIISYLKQ